MVVSIHVMLALQATLGICDGRILEFRHADTDVDFCFIVENNICRLIIAVKPELNLIKDLLPIASTSRPSIANTFVVRRPLPINQKASQIKLIML